MSDSLPGPWSLQGVVFIIYMALKKAKVKLLPNNLIIYK